MLKLLTNNKWASFNGNFLIFKRLTIILLTTSVLLLSCKKKEASTPVVYFESPKKMEIITDSKEVLLKGIIQNDDGLEIVQIKLISPDNNISEVVLDLSLNSSILPFEHAYKFEKSNFQTGQYKIAIDVFTKDKDLHFERNFSYDTGSNTSGGPKYSLWMNNTELSYHSVGGVKLYNKTFYSSYSNSVTQKGYIYAYNPSKGVMRINNDSAKREETVIASSSISIFESFEVLDEENLLIALEENNRFKLASYLNHVRTSEINNTTFRIKKATALDEFIFSLDLRDGTNTDFQIAYYNRSTGSKLGTQPIQASKLIEIFHFGDKNSVYALIHAKSSNESKILRFNKSKNSVAELFTIPEKVALSNVIKIGSSKILFATQSNIYTFNGNGEPPKRVLLNVKGSIITMKTSSSHSEFAFLGDFSGKRKLIFFDFESLDKTQEIEVNGRTTDFNFIVN